MGAGWSVFDWQEYIRRQLEEEQRHLEILQQQLLHEQAMLLVSVCLLWLNTGDDMYIWSITSISIYLWVLAPVLPLALVPSVCFFK